jgi:hypothetical protein
VVSFVPIREFRLSKAQVVTFTNATVFKGFQAELASSDETGAAHGLFAHSSLNTAMQTLSGVAAWPSNTGNNSGVSRSPPVCDRWQLSLNTRAATGLGVRLTKPAQPRDTNMFSKTKMLFSAAIVVSTAVSASAAPGHRPAHVHRPAIYNMVPGYNSQTYSNSNDPRSTGGGSLGYNQMLLID